MKSVVGFAPVRMRRNRKTAAPITEKIMTGFLPNLSDRAGITSVPSVPPKPIAEST
ncbi:hypothetical protein AWB79_07606 [Caballeronia hypogeia]|uniref:Uncharacterized protein n=1 Tax=Caballeronia hypogeia TaxID=1777140 RepID=A0A158DWC9_9BURK|nr:hypothetical protein AWB79_07606 [Caballeronia hypogeia]